MAQLMRCKSCGFIVSETDLGDVCPACGVPRKMFEPYTDPVSAKRRRILSLDVHPIVVHFSISFAVSALAVSLFTIVFPQFFRVTATSILRAFIGALPLVLIATFFSGRFDGRMRFRRAKSPLLRTKTVVGIVFFFLSAAAAAITFAVGPYVPWVRPVDAVLLAGCTACAFVQGRIGVRLLGAIFPG